jgi:hypothetical protein
VLLPAGWVVPNWWEALQCRALCTPQPASALLQLGSGVSVRLLREDASGRRRHIDYVTQHDVRNWPQVCAEAWEVFRALEARGRLAGAPELILEPTDRRIRFLGWTWSGPVLTCCVSTGVIFRQTDAGKWNASGGCGE